MNGARQLRRIGIAGLAVAVAMALAISAEVASAQPIPNAAQPWRDAGRLFTQHFKTPLVATSQSGVFAAVAISKGGTGNELRRVKLIRRLPDGTTQTATTKLSRLEGIDVDPRGSTLVLGSRHKTVVATTWREGAARPRTRTAFDGRAFPGVGIDGRLLTNSIGDAAFVFVDRSKTAHIVRRHAGSTQWRKPIEVSPEDYDSPLVDLELAPDGSLDGAFLHDHVVDLRTLARDSRVFGTAQPAVSWPDIDDLLDYYREQVDLTVGPNGDQVVVLTYLRFDADDEDPHISYTYRYVVLSSRHEPFEGQALEVAGNWLDRPIIGLDGSVGIESPDIVRWTPGTWPFDSVGLGYRLTASPRGDLLFRRDEDRGPLSIWPLGEDPFDTSAPPRGKAAAWLMTNTHRAYVVTKRDGRRPGYYLSIGSLHRN